MGSKLRLITVDDDAEVRAFVRNIGVRMGYDVVEISDPTTFAEVVAKVKPRIIVLDLNMPGLDGVTLLRQLQAGKSDSKLIFLSGCDSRTLRTVQDLAKAYGLDAIGAVKKPPTVAAIEGLLKSTALPPPEFVAQDLEEALVEGDISVYYQPKVHWREDRWVIESVEALARWQHRTFGLLTPAAFIPLAEQSGLIDTVTQIVIDQTVCQLRDWSSCGLNLAAAVNLSPLLLNDLAVPDRINGVLQKYRVDCSRLTVEVTESAAISDARDAMDVLTRLRVMGVGLSIDDYGTGSSSLLQLFRMPFNELKIDQCFVARIPESEEARRIVQATVDLAHSLKITACAEGVELQSMLDFLQSIGCDMAQGYLISPPMPAAEVAGFVQRWNPEPARETRRTGSR